jgi:class 3 adenylate cyclase/isopentenyldiphosphate isomerase
VAEDKSAVVVFVDVRGFTNWSEANEVFVNLADFVTGFMNILRKRFPPAEWTLKPLGDGALLMTDAAGAPTPKSTSALLKNVLKRVSAVDADFEAHCADFGRRIGHVQQLRLGWGVVRGKVMKVGDDWAGHNLNKCSRLCDEARPFGVVVDQDDFPDLPQSGFSFVPQVKKLRGIGDVRVWSSVEVASHFVRREQLREEPEVHVAGTCVRDVDGELSLLVARRAADRKLYPGKLEGCGGQLRRSESFADGVRRHFDLELGLDVEVLTTFHRFYEVREPDLPLIPGVRFLCLITSDREPRSDNHSEVRWLTEAEFRETPAAEFVGDLKQEVLELVNEYKVRSPG